MILAGAGSGKTTVIVNRIAYLLEAEGVSSYSVLAITFTNKAAAEMKTRLEKMLGLSARDIWASTFHSACVKILRRDIEKIGYPSQFSIFDTSDQLSVIKECQKELGISDSSLPPKQVLSAIGRAKDELIGPEEYESMYAGDFRLSQISNIYGCYRDKLKAYGALDFDDIIMLTVRLFEQYPNVLSFYQNKFKYILVDEYQDTNHAQYRLVSLLAQKHRNLCVVGDDDQSIYKFRGANIENILSFEERFPEAKVIKLEENYRSTQNILEAANNVIKNNIGRKSKRLWTSKGVGEKITVYQSNSEYDEARFIVSEIERSARKYNDYAVLYRMNSQSRVIEDALTRAAIPYRVLGGLRFYDRKEIKDAVAYLRLIFNRGDNISLKRIINEPKRGIGKTTLEKMEELAGAYNLSLYEICKNAGRHPGLSRAADRLEGFANLIEDLSKTEQSPLDEFLSNVLTETGYIPELEREGSTESRWRLDNLYELIASAKEYEQANDEPSLGGFLENIALVSDVDNYDETQDTVVLMTLHSAKGLEFPVVFIAGAEEGVFPSYLSIGNKEELEEERRLCYVGITRAKEMLYITHAATRTLFGATTHNRVSRFVEELPGDLTEYKSQTDENKITELTFSANVSLAKPSVKKPAISFAAGNTVMHKKFGKGIVLKAIEVGNDYHLEVAFDSVGTKHLMAAYANLTKL